LTAENEKQKTHIHNAQCDHDHAHEEQDIMKSDGIRMKNEIETFKGEIYSLKGQK